MPIPFPAQPSIVAGEYPDTVIVFAPPSGKDADGAPSTTPGAAGSPIACAVYEVQRGMGTAYEGDPVPLGATEYEIAFPGDPAISEALQVVHWTKHYNVSLPTVIAFVTNGRARRPHDFDAEFVVSVMHYA